MSKPPGISCGNIQCFFFLKIRPINLANDHLRQPLSSFDHKRLFSMIDKDKPNLPPIVSINGPGCVKQGNPIVKSQPAPGPDLSFIAGRNRKRNTRRDEFPFPWI